MRHATGLLAVLTISTLASANESPPKAPVKAPPKATATASVTLSERAQMLAPIEVESLTLTPIVAKAAPEVAEDLLVPVLDACLAQRHRQCGLREAALS